MKPTKPLALFLTQHDYETPTVISYFYNLKYAHIECKHVADFKFFHSRIVMIHESVTC